MQHVEMNVEGKVPAGINIRASTPFCLKEQEVMGGIKKGQVLLINNRSRLLCLITQDPTFFLAGPTLLF